MKTRSTKKALLASLLSLVVCVSMLVGTTFAWFTDSVTSTNNIIKSGNLDVELEWSADMVNWNPVNSGTNVFKTDTLWEPGHTEVVYLRVSNLGSLALKYQLGVNIASEVEGVNVAGEKFKLSDYIYYGVADVTAKYADRAAAVAAVKNSSTILSQTFNKSGSLVANAAPVVVAMVVYMPETVGNEANHNGTAPVINLGINLFATQMTAESDSFNNQYDKDAWHPNFVVTNSDELKVALTNGGNVALANDVIISESLPVTKDTVIDLNGKNIGTSGSTNGSPLYLKGGKLTVKNGTLDLDGSQTNVNGTFSTAIGYDAQTELVVENVNFTGKTAINGTFATDGPLKIAISDCTMDVTSVGIAVSANSTEAIATINNCNIDAGEYAIFASQGSKITINGGTYKSAGKVITSMYDKTVVTINGGTFDGKLWVTDGGSLVIKGGTFTADPSAWVADGHVVKNNNGTWTVERKYINVVSAGENKDVNGAALATAIAATTEASFIKLPEGEYKMPGIDGNKDVTIVGTKDTVIDVTAGAYMDGSKVAFEGVTIKGGRGKVNGNGSDDAALYTPNVTYTDCTFDGPLAVGRDGAKFIRCTFNNLGNDYVWNMSNDTVFEGCTFNTDGKALLLYAHGSNAGDEMTTVVVKNCVFNATKKAYAGAVSNLPCAAIEIHNYGCGFNLTTSGNTYDSNFSGEWRIKTYETGNALYTITVNGAEYTTTALDGKTMTVTGGVASFN